jgi:hypothetical protein
MLARIAVALISFLPLLANSADWQLVADTKLGQLKLDTASVGKDGKYTAAVLVYSFKSLQRLTTPPNPVFNKRQDDLLVDCVHSKLGVHSSSFFEDEKLAGKYTLEAEKIRFNTARPGSMAEKVVKAVCAAAPKSKP